VPESKDQINDIADMMFTRALLGVERVDSTSIKDAKDRITVRIEDVFQSRNTTYIHYSIRNHSTRPYRVTTPQVAEAIAPEASISIPSLRRMQLDGQMLHKMGKLRERQLTLAKAEVQKEDIQPGEETRGVIAIRETVAGPSILQLKFGPEGSHPVQATMVF
jgi:hypothetical protein